MGSLRAAYILLTFALSSLVVIPYQTFALHFKTLGYKNIPERYQRFLSRLFGIRVTVIGKPVQDRGVLMVSNHTSYLDILALGGIARVSFVAKSEVAKWPLFGTFARLQRTVFVERQRRSQTGVSRDQIRERLLEGDALVLFPEGTSNDGNRVLPFKSALMGAAESQIGTDAQGKPVYVPVQPVSISYVGVHGMPMGRENRPLYAWYGDMELVDHLWEGLKTGPVDVLIEFHEPMTVDVAGGRKNLARIVEEKIRHGQAMGLAGLAGRKPVIPAPTAALKAQAAE
ncbi:MAG: 1-acyl-sn-glycerol-3-phosphate acyltransferase [Proteobacteria bacterium]|nr:1-acyl-sn-glycerol-3-phosphate acyltransferase [Pseudomonadota bacterium]